MNFIYYFCKMKTLIIHPEDITTDFLKEIYCDSDHIIINSNVSKKHLKEQIKTHDRIIMLGHGNYKGLFGFKRFMIDSTLVYLLREKLCICIWCNANIFFEKYKLKGIYSGMIISEYEEALDYCINTTEQHINKSNILFAKSIKFV